MKTVFKVTWISFLSTIVRGLAQMLTKEGFKNVSSINTMLGPLPIYYFIVNFVFFLAITIMFIPLNKYIPSSKLTKGIVYSMSIGLIWFALRFEPNTYINALAYIVDIIVFFIPLAIAGVFLGYLADDEKRVYKPSKNSFIASTMVAAFWIVGKIIYFLLDPKEPKDTNLLTNMIWLLLTGLIIGMTIIIIFETIKAPRTQTFMYMSIMLIIIFIGFYTYKQVINPKFYFLLTLKPLIDIVFVTSGLLLVERVFMLHADTKEELG